jgi:7-carboxy-7-deazaguanine synthase
MLNIVERFISISGEAPIIGQPAYFYRFSGCNLCCDYCDTDYKDENNLELSEDAIIEDIQEKIKNYPILKVIFTGGEPLLGNRQDKLFYIMEKLPDIDFYIETNGAVEIHENRLPNCHFVCDYKGPASGECGSFKENNLCKLNSAKDCLKFVLSKGDLKWFSEKVSDIYLKNKQLPIYASAVHGKLELDFLTEFILDEKLPVNISVQLHKIIWPNTDRGV